LTVIGLERQHRRGPVALNWLGFLRLKGARQPPGRPLNLGELLAAICGLAFGPGAKTVDVCVRWVRRQRASIR
jgi:hypothetical protein